MPRKKKSTTEEKNNDVSLHSNVTYYFTDSDGTEGCSNMQPYRHAMGFWMTDEPNNIVELPKGTILRLYNKSLTFDDEPIVEEIVR